MEYNTDEQTARDDVATLTTIIDRQGSSMFLAVLAEKVGRDNLRFNWSDQEIGNIKTSMVTELASNIDERV